MVNNLQIVFCDTVVDKNDEISSTYTAAVTDARLQGNEITLSFNQPSNMPSPKSIVLVCDDVVDGKTTKIKLLIINKVDGIIKQSSTGGQCISLYFA